MKEQIKDQYLSLCHKFLWPLHIYLNFLEISLFDVFNMKPLLIYELTSSGLSSIAFSYIFIAS